MTEFDYLTLISSLRAENGAHTINYFSVLTAYLLAVYLVGRKIGFLLIILLTVLYSLFQLTIITSLNSAIVDIIGLSSRYASEYPLATVPGMGEYIPTLQLAISVGGWLLSLIFMIYMAVTSCDDDRPRIKEAGVLG